MKKGLLPGSQSTTAAEPGTTHSIRNSFDASNYYYFILISVSSWHQPGARAFLSHVLIDAGGLGAEREGSGGDFRMKGEHGMKNMR